MPPIAQKKAAPAAGVNFGEMSFYTQGGGLPEGDYIWKELDIRIFSGFKEATAGSSNKPRLGVMITLLPLGEGEERQQFYSMGSKADQSFVPNETGKGIVPVPGGPASTMNNSTNWALLVKSLYDSGLPQGILSNDISVLEGTHVHMANVPEPAERAGFQVKTGEAAEERKPGQIAIVTEIKEDGKPWEGSGGIPEETKAKPVTATGKTNGNAAPAEVARATDAVDGDVEAAATSGANTFLTSAKLPCPKVMLRTGTFKAVNAESGQDMAQKAINTYFGSDAMIESLIEPLGFKLSKDKSKIEAA